jgi:hypothetical protein
LGIKLNRIKIECELKNGGTMPFIKGMKKHPQSGKKKGATHATTFRKTIEVIKENSLNPTEEILKLIPHLELKDQMKAWFELLSYSQPKPMAEAETLDYPSATLAEKLKDVSSEELILLLRQNTNTIPAGE